MAAAAPQTPQRQMPGIYYNTPAPGRPGISSFSSSGRMSSHHGAQQGPGEQTVAYPNLNGSTNNALSSQMPASAPKNMSLIERGAKTLVDKLEQDRRFPALEDYVVQGASANYEIPSSAAWAPFQRIKIHDIPDQILEQYNNAQFSTSLGLFAEIGHAWVAIDNSLYLWDFTHPHPEVLGYEEAQSGITCVQLVKPRAGVFVPTITHLIVVATATDIQLVGVACEANAVGSKTVNLFRTDMRTQTNRIPVDCIVGSPKTGRIFFSGRTENEVYELIYQQEDSWFRPKCSKVCQTRSSARSYIPSLRTRAAEHVKQLTVDDTRNTLYALSSASTIRAFTIRGASELPQSTEQRFATILTNIRHKVPESQLLRQDTPIATIISIPSNESSSLWLMAITSTGCRIYFSGVSGSYYSSSSDGVISLGVCHVRFPPSTDPADSVSNAVAIPGQQYQNQAQSYQSGVNSSKALIRTTGSYRFSPGYFTCFVDKGVRGEAQVFLSAPDTGRIALTQDGSPSSKFPETAQWMTVDMPLDVGLTHGSYAASSSPRGFGNELAVQYDQPMVEMAILTNSSVIILRRRKLVDVFAAVIRSGGSADGLTGEIRNFAHRYGRGETIATALAVACGQASEVASDYRIARVTDNQVLQAARETFINHGGRPELDQYAIPDSSSVPNIDQIRPSPRHDGLALYMARLLRSVWQTRIVAEQSDKSGALKISPTLPLDKVQGIQRDLVRLQEFLDDNKSSIQGLAGPDALGRVATKQDEVALQAEHRALTSLTRLITDVVEGLSFVLVLFEENLVDIVLSLPDGSRQQVREMTYERLFCTGSGKDLAKELVKAIVNRNIAQGMNIDTVTDALRRRCGSFCSAEDSTIFRAQEQLKRASDATMSNENSRHLLNQSLQNLLRVSSSLTLDQLKWAVQQYNSLQFFAGAIQLVLSVANEHDRGNSAIAWFKEGQPGQDARQAAFNHRQACYEQVHEIILAVDSNSATAPETVDGHYTVQARRKREAYEMINTSADELFHINLYDWYIENGWTSRILDTRSPFVVTYLQRQADSIVERADLLAQYFAHHHDFLEAARVQLTLAKSDFQLDLGTRITYLSYARTNASTKTVGLSSPSGSFSSNGAYAGNSRQTRQQLLKEINDLLELASIQSELLSRIKDDPRIAVTKRPDVIRNLDGPVLGVDKLYNGYADPGGYYDIALYIYQAADYRNPTDVRATWTSLIEATHEEAMEEEEQDAGDDTTPNGNARRPNASTARPWEVLGEKVRSIGNTLASNESVFPLNTVIPLLYRYLIESHQHAPLPPSEQRPGEPVPDVAAPHFIPSIFVTPPLSSTIPMESVVAELEALYYVHDVPYKTRSARRLIASDLVWSLGQWFEKTRHGGLPNLFSGGESAQGVLQLLSEVVQGEGAREQGIGAEAGELMRAISGVLR